MKLVRSDRCVCVCVSGARRLCVYQSCPASNPQHYTNTSSAGECQALSSAHISTHCTLLSLFPESPPPPYSKYPTDFLKPPGKSKFYIEFNVKRVHFNTGLVGVVTQQEAGDVTRVNSFSLFPMSVFPGLSIIFPCSNIVTPCVLSSGTNVPW